MAEYIERQKAISPLYRWKNIIKNTYGENDEYVRCLTEAIEKIKDVPSADVAPVRHGRWIEYGEPDEWKRFQTWYWKCSKCGAVGIEEWNYCPNCGAKMDGYK